MKAGVWSATVALFLTCAPAVAQPLDRPGRMHMVELPPVAPEVVAEAVDRPKDAVGGGVPEEFLKPLTLTVSPGVNELVYVRENDLNRFVTPFANPDVAGPEGLTVEVHGNVVYVAPPNGPKPVSIYITEKGDQAAAISLTLVPKDIPSREVRLVPAGGRMPQVVGSPAQAQHWEQSHPYLDAVRLVMRDIALEKIPQGYSLRDTESRDRIPGCQPPSGVQVSFTGGQTMGGSSLEVRIGTVTNRTGAPVDLLETWCAQDYGVAAVAFWPHVVLPPGQRTEIYVALRRNTTERPSAAATRPSLLDGAR